jgi:hypothetical protein
VTQAEFNARSATLIRDFEREVKRRSIEETRRRYRDEHQLIYVRRHTVEAYFRRRKLRAR